MSCAIPLGKWRFRSELDSSSYPVQPCDVLRLAQRRLRGRRLINGFNFQRGGKFIRVTCLLNLDGEPARFHAPQHARHLISSWKYETLPLKVPPHKEIANRDGSQVACTEV